MKSFFIEKINELTITAIQSLFSKTYIDSKHYSAESVPSFKTNFLVQIGLRGKHQECMVILGIPKDTAKNVLEEVMSLAGSDAEVLEITKSALGELANTMACEFAMFDEFVKSFGKLHPTPPLVWVIDEKVPDFIEGNGLSGRLKDKDFQLYTHVCFFDAKQSKADANNWNPTKSLSIYDPSSR